MGLVTRYIVDIQENLRMLLKQPVEKEMLHQFRVQVKKMKAIWAIHPFGNSIRFNQSFPLINKHFNRAATIRDLQMIVSCIETLPGFTKHPELKKNLVSLIKKQTKKFSGKLKQRRLRFGIYEEIRIFLAYFRISSATLIRQNRKASRDLTLQMLRKANGKDPEGLHHTRKQCKYLLFQYQAFHSNTTLPQKGLNAASLDHLQHLLGAWHDWWNTVTWLHQLDEMETPSGKLKQLMHQAGKKEEMLRSEVLKVIQKTIQLDTKKAKTH